MAPELKSAYTLRRSALEGERSAFMERAAAFNAKKAADQGDAEYTALESERSAYILKAKAFNKELALAVGFAGEVEKMKAQGKTVARAAEIKGDFHIVLKDGRTFSGADAAQVPLDGSIRLYTGDKSEVKLFLADGTYFQLRENTDLTITSFEHDAPASAADLVGRMTQGVLHWVHEVGEPRQREHLSIRVASAVVAVRGTDVELEVSPDGSGLYVLRSGLVDVTDGPTGRIVTLHPGEQVRFTPSGSVGTVEPLGAGPARTP